MMQLMRRDWKNFSRKKMKKKPKLLKKSKILTKKKKRNEAKAMAMVEDVAEEGKESESFEINYK